MDEPIRYPVLTKSSKKITTCTGKSKKLNNTCKRKNNDPIYSVQIVNASTVENTTFLLIHSMGFFTDLSWRLKTGGGESL